MICEHTWKTYLTTVKIDGRLVVVYKCICGHIEKVGR